MEEFLKNLLLSANGLIAYVSIFGVLVACGLGVPLPEDISLILGGFLAHEGAVNLPMMMGVGFLGILVGDTCIYVAGRRVGSRMANPTGFWSRVVTPAKRAKVERLFATHGEKIVMIARFLPGVRAVTYFTAGSARMGYLRFIVWDGLAALASAPLFVYLGFHFGAELELVLVKLKQGQAVVLGVLAVALITFFVLRHLRRVRAAQVPVPSNEAPAKVEAPLDAPKQEKHSGPSASPADSQLI